MGKFIYEGGVKTEVDDRALAHIQIAVVAKLRRAEPFSFSWREDMSVGGGRTTVWVHAGSNLVFKYDAARPPVVNHEWVEALMSTANSPSGLHLVPEPSAGRDAKAPQ